VSFANTIQGRKADTITETYFKNNPTYTWEIFRAFT
jgi:hypothetical protein